MTKTPSGSFGRRGARQETRRESGYGPAPAEQPKPSPRRRVPTISPRFARQLGGIAVGVAIVIGLNELSKEMMREVGRSLDDAFVEQARPGDAAGAIDRIGEADARLASIHRRCDGQTHALELTKSQERALDGDPWLERTERKFWRSSNYVACLARTDPHRFCDEKHKAHLVAATREHFKLAGQLREEWSSVVSGSTTRIMGLPATRAELLAARVPSFLPNTPMITGIRNLIAAGYVKPSDFGGFLGIGIPEPISRAAEGVTPRKADCG